uniref:HIT-type domain-containing protein n=1 Tax=Peronospora matthiolae TaxID=2874970 RepID=A0AAV1U0Y9_9STRA
MAIKRVPLRLGSLRTTLKPSSTDVSSSLVSESPSLTNASLSRICHVCTTREAKYTCPRCNASYCCVDCYRSHGTSCTEPFFEIHVRNEMQLTVNERNGENEKKQQQKSVQELLERVREFQGDQQQLLTCTDYDDEEALIERMQELAVLNKAGELTLESLTPEERKVFLGEVTNGRLGKLVELWSPWWLLSEHKYRSETLARRRELIMEELGGHDNKEEEATTVRAEVLYPVGLFTNVEAQKMPKCMNALLPDGRKPSPCLHWHLVELLFGYALVLRAYNGDYEQDVAEAALMLLDLCQVLSADARYGSVEHVCLACLEKLCNGGPAANKLAIQDTQQILRSNVFLLDALSDMRLLLKKYKQKELEHSAECDKQARKERKTATKRLAIVQKKLQFYQSWAYLTSIDEFQELAKEIQAYTRDKVQLN